MSRSILWSVRLGLLWLLGACAALPDVTPFETATRDLAAAVKTAGDAAVGEVQRMQDVFEREYKKPRGGLAESAGRREDGPAPSPEERVAVLAERLRKAWDEGNAVMNAFVRYSASMHDLVVSAHDGTEAAKALADRVAGLATSLGWADSSGVGGVAADGVALIWSQIALARTASTLEEAMSTLHPAVERMTEVFDRKLAAALDAAEGAAQFQRGRIEQSKAYIAAVDAAKKAETKRTEILKELSVSPAEGANAVSRLNELAEVLAAADAAAAPYAQRLKEIDLREAALRELISSVRSGFDRWSVTHADLLAAVRARRKIDTSALIEVAVEVRRLVRKVKEL